MALERIDFAGFRNLRDSRLELSPDLNLILGPNGQGKTNLLEAVYVLGTGKSFRTRVMREVIGWDATTATLHGRGTTLGSLGIELSKSGKRYVRDGANVSVGGYLGGLTPVAFTAESARLASDPPAARRAFVDRGILGLQPGYLTTLTSFAEALRQKNRLLGKHRTSRPDRDTLAAFNAALAHHGAEVVRRRQGYLGALKKLPTVTAELAPRGAELQVTYEGPAVRACGEHTESAALLQAIESLESEEMRQGHALLGPQRDDLKIRFEARSLARFGSAGERRRAALVLKLATMLLLSEEDCSTPVMLIDDIDAELDDERISRTLDFVRGRCQTLVTTSKRHVADQFLSYGNLLIMESGRILHTAERPGAGEASPADAESSRT